MKRNSGFLLPFTFRGRPWKNRNNYQIIHAAQRPPEESDIDFSTLGLKFVPTYNPEFIIKKSGWSPPPSDNNVTSNLPFIIKRTVVGSSIPVYTDYKAGRTKVVTILRKCAGDIATLKEEMEKVVGKPVEIRPGKLVVNGNYSMRLKKWLLGLGF